jgi:hypothetical protein
MPFKTHDPAPHGAVGFALAAADAFFRIDSQKILLISPQRGKGATKEF